MEIVVIGGGIAGLSAAQSARETDSEARITLVCGEGCLPYYRPRICQVLSGLDQAKLLVRSEEWFTANRIQPLLVRATNVGRDLRQVRLADGSVLPLDRLVIASGGRGQVPEAEGNERENVFCLRTLADIQRLRPYTGPLVIVGDGLLGLEAAWHLSRSGRSVTVIGRNNRLLPRQLDKEGSVFLLELTERAGVRVALNGQLAVVEDGRAVLADGRAFDAEATILAAGIKSVTNLAPALGLELGRGIKVDQRMQTSEPQVFAAGDCAEFDGRVSGLWTAAMAQGKVAGINAAGGSAVYQPEPPAYQLNAMGTSLWSYGQVEAEEGYSRRDAGQGHFAKVFLSQGRLVGAELIGNTAGSSRLKKAVDAGENDIDALWRQLGY